MQLSTDIDVAEQVKQLSALARQDEPVVVRNQLPGISTFTDENTKINMVWQGAGDAKGGDIKEVPPSMLLNPQFRENVLRGIYKIEVDPEILNRALGLQRADWDHRQLEKSNASAQIEQSNDTVIGVGVACIAPRGPRELCGSYGLVLGKNPDEAPPLCAEHQHLASQYAPTTTGRQVGGKDEVIWKRVSLVQN
jgi:hypothetical protein